MSCRWMSCMASRGCRSTRESSFTPQTSMDVMLMRLLLPQQVLWSRNRSRISCELGKDNAMQDRRLEGSADGVRCQQALLCPEGQMLCGKTSMGCRARAAFNAAPGDRELQINIGAARLANGDHQGALASLRSVWQKGLGGLQSSSQQALLRNLATAEAKVGSLAVALKLRLKWFDLNPSAVPMQRWLSWAQQGLDDQKDVLFVRLLWRCCKLAEVVPRSQYFDSSLTLWKAKAITERPHCFTGSMRPQPAKYR